MRREKFRRRDWDDPSWREKVQEYSERRQRSKVFFGIAIAAIGAAWIFCTVYHIDFDIEAQWPYLMIAFGILIGIKNGFRNSVWWILCLIGVGNALENNTHLHQDIIWGSMMVAAGLIIALKPRRDCKPKFKMDRSITSENTINIDVTFGGRKEVITAREFKQGDISVTFAGCELNFMQADFDTTAVLDLRVAFGGVEITIPSHWHVRNEINSSFGSVEDERNIQTSQTVESKTLILRGTCAFGNVEIRSF